MARRPATRRFFRAFRALEDFSRAYCAAPPDAQVPMLHRAVYLLVELNMARSAAVAAWESGREHIPRVACLHWLARCDQALARMQDLNMSRHSTEPNP